MGQTTMHSERAATSEAPALDRGLLALGAVVVLGSAMSILDATIVNVAIPTLRHDFGTSLSTIQWVLTGYLLGFVTVIPLTGWASERFGTRSVWIAALVVFLAGSALAGAAWSIGSLIAFRVLQGLGGGMIMPVGQTMLAQAAGPGRIGRVMSLVGIPMLLAPILGPVIGGAIVGSTSWRWIFLVNLPVGALALTLAARVLPPAGPRRAARLDGLGVALLPPGVAAFVYGMSEAGNRGSFSDPRALAWIAAGVVLVALFGLHALRLRSAALVDVTLFARRGFAAAAATNFLIGVALFGSLILLPLYYQLVRGQSPLQTGLLLVPNGLGAAVAMPIAGQLTDRIGARRVIPVGVLLALAGIAGYTQVGATTSYALLAACLFLVGAGLGATIMPSMSIAYQSVERDAVPRASSAINVVQRTAGSIGTAVFAVILQRRLAGSTGTASVAAAFGSTFWFAAAALATALVPALLLPRRRFSPDQGSG